MADLTVTCGAVELRGEIHPGDGPVIVLLHAGVTDRRGWRTVTKGLSPAAAVVSYDRRGFGETQTTPEEFGHLDDLLAVMDSVATGPVWLVGSSAGGGIAIEAALTVPERVAGLVLIAPAVKGAPEYPLTAAEESFEPLAEAAEAAGDVAELVRIDTWLWLDGPNVAEGRVTGPVRELMIEMDSAIVANELGGGPAAESGGTEVWTRLGELTMPVTVACGDLDVSALVERSRAMTDLIPGAHHVVLAGMAHLPYLEQPAAVVGLIADAVGLRL
jgi:pimeloyl-ACP methyl ester carboxylesterase